VTAAESQGLGRWSTRRTSDGGYALIQPDGHTTGVVYLGVDGFQKAEAEAERLNVQRGYVGALAVRDLVDAVRQDLAVAGADLGSVRLLLGRVFAEKRPDDLEKLYQRLQGVQDALGRIGRKTDLAMERASRAPKTAVPLRPRSRPSRSVSSGGDGGRTHGLAEPKVQELLAEAEANG